MAYTPRKSSMALTQASSPLENEATNSDENEDSMDLNTILSQETLLKVQHSFKRLVRDQRAKMK